MTDCLKIAKSIAFHFAHICAYGVETVKYLNSKICSAEKKNTALIIEALLYVTIKLKIHFGSLFRKIFQHNQIKVSYGQSIHLTASDFSHA